MRIAKLAGYGALLLTLGCCSRPVDSTSGGEASGGKSASGPRPLQVLPKEARTNLDCVGDGSSCGPAAVDMFTNGFAGTKWLEYIADVEIAYDPLAGVDVSGAPDPVVPVEILAVNEVFIDRTKQKLHLYVPAKCAPNGLCKFSSDSSWFVNSGRVLLAASINCAAEPPGHLQMVYAFPIEDGLLYGFTGDTMPWEEARKGLAADAAAADLIGLPCATSVPDATTTDETGPPPSDSGPDAWP